eukprot:CAMPEP_0196768336 /NCGR_PEP_ID=MMETSP1095-20130614/42640_1 /TAXON_ID=96789 ORGANISM="Chromulina nebulosa, Strain UTEXLB2642" /NCGR_SAMPLE_ID=MMETSP1095 /ASSEMBLY_ACC=CAM_ASM_000446 /LENGTH=55 /DNA_ID=CAMNT_0042137797 /DNA_START=2694 /DNA_END=2858 /DNA_ORIENTATION=-
MRYIDDFTSDDFENAQNKVFLNAWGLNKDGHFMNMAVLNNVGINRNRIYDYLFKT